MTKAMISEFLGTLLLLATVVGSGIMGDSLSGGNIAIALLANAFATGAMLYVLINIFRPQSGAHFNPAVTLAMAFTKQLPRAHVGPYILAQILGASAGVTLAHAMFDQSLVQVSTKIRWGTGQWSCLEQPIQRVDARDPTNTEERVCHDVLTCHRAGMRLRQVCSLH